MKKYFIYFFLVINCSCCLSNAHSQDNSQNKLPLTDEQIAKKSVINEGNLTAIKALLNRAAKGDDITVGAIGGSITMGAAATKPENRFANLTAQWFRNKFPEIDVKLYNAGIGATDSKLGSLRLHKDLMIYNPDLVIVEYSINDSENEIPSETFEGLIRQLLSADNQPAIIILAMMNSAGKNVEEKHVPVAKHYDLPMVSLRKVFEPLIQTSKVNPDTLLADSVHPNDAGHKTAALLITNILQKALELSGQCNTASAATSIKSDTAAPDALSIPQPLFTDKYQFVKYLKPPEIETVNNKGWKLRSHPQNAIQPWRLHGKPLFDKVWTAETPGSKLEFKYEGTFAAITYWKENSAMGTADVYVDGKKIQSIDAWGPQTWGGFAATKIIGHDLPLGEHTVSIVLSQEKNAQSNGHCFDLLAFGFGQKNYSK